MKKYLLFIFIVISLNSVNAQYDWERLSYSHFTGSGEDNSKTYYLINIDKSGKGRLEYFKSGKVHVAEYTVSRKKLNHLNEKIEKSGMLKLNPADLKSDNPVSSSNLYTMTLVLEKDFGEEHEKQTGSKELHEKENENEKENEKEEESEKPQIIPVPDNLKSEYRKIFYDLYYEIEKAVPEKAWKDAGSE